MKVTATCTRRALGAVRAYVGHPDDNGAALNHALMEAFSFDETAETSDLISIGETFTGLLVVCEILVTTIAGLTSLDVERALDLVTGEIERSITDADQS